MRTAVLRRSETSVQSTEQRHTTHRAELVCKPALQFLRQLTYKADCPCAVNPVAHRRNAAGNKTESRRPDTVQKMITTFRRRQVAASRRTYRILWARRLYSRTVVAVVGGRDIKLVSSNSLRDIPHILVPEYLEPRAARCLARYKDVVVPPL